MTRKGNYSLNQTAKNVGVKNFDKFHNAGYKGLYIGVRYEIKGKQMSNHSLIPVNESIVTKIKNFFKNLFGQQSIEDYKIENTDNIVENQEEIKNSIFAESIKVEETEEQKLLRLQKLIREKRISENDLSIEERDKLRKLYNF